MRQVHPGDWIAGLLGSMIEVAFAIQCPGGEMDSIKLEYSKSGCFGFFLRILGIKPKEAAIEPSPYRLRDDFLSNAEHSFYLVLRQMMGEYFTICTKVNLADLFYVSKPHENRTARNKIDRKHVDFLICDPKTMKPRFGIELDDASHHRTDRQARDSFIDEVFAQAGLPLLRVNASNSYNQSELGERFKEAISQPSHLIVSQPSQLNEEQEVGVIPSCPKCGVPMVLRKAQRGTRRGESFYGCVNYPRCREIIPIEYPTPEGGSD